MTLSINCGALPLLLRQGQRRRQARVTGVMDSDHIAFDCWPDSVLHMPETVLNQPESLNWMDDFFDFPEPEVEFRSFSDQVPAVSSPTQSEYSSILKTLEMELSNSKSKEKEEGKNDQEEEAVEGLHGNGIASQSKNLGSERNRRKRLSQQLLALRSIVPHISKGQRRRQTVTGVMDSDHIAFNCWPDSVHHMAETGLNQPESLKWMDDFFDFPEPEVELRSFSDQVPAVSSPTQSEYSSILKTLEMQLSKSKSKEKEEGKNDQEEEAVEGLHGNGIASQSKNLGSERNRRKRLSQQLLALRSIVPHISKMDKTSILSDALAYLQSLHKQIEETKKELSEKAMQESDSNAPCSPEGEAQNLQFHGDIQSNQHQILQIDTEKLDERSFSVSVSFKKGPRAVGQVQRMIESLGLDISCTYTHQTDQNCMLTTAFLSVKKQRRVTPQSLKAAMNKAAFKFGLGFDVDD